jgi:SRSO17 transposase
MQPRAAVADVAAWEREFERWLAPFVAALGDRRRGRWAPVYVRGLLAPGERKSIEPVAARVAPADYQQLHHFVCGACWDPTPLETVLAAEGQRLVGGPDAVLIIDDTALLKQGRHSVGVARQYAGAAGKMANCQTLVSVTLARAEVPVPLALRLFLPEAWTADPERCRAAGVPEARLTFRTKPALALAEVDRLRALGVEFGRVLADAAYGMGVEFRRGLSARGLLWAVGLMPNQLVYPADVAVRRPRRKRGPGRTGRPPTRPRPTRAPASAEDMLAGARWRRVTWRDGTKGPLAAPFAAARVRIADGPTIARGQRLPGDEEVWLVGEERATGERKYYVSNLPATATLKELASAIKARWVCEQAHQQLKEELGLDHFEGRSWVGLHHHALLTQLAFTFLQHLRLRESAASAPPAMGARGKNRRVARPPRAAAATDAPHTAAAPRPAARRRRAALPEMPRAAHLRAARVTSDLAE